MGNSDHFDTIVLGAGIMGAWSALHLVKRGRKTLLIDQFPLPHTRGSSHGQTRIFRFAYPEDHQTIMSKNSYPMWKDLEKESGEELLKKCSLLRLADSAEGHQVIDECLNSLRKCSEPSDFEELNAVELAARFPGLAFGDAARGLLDHNGHVLMADRCLRACLMVFKNLGGTVVDGYPVKTVIPGDIVEVALGDKRKFSAESLVISAGSWAGTLSKQLNLELPLRVIKIPIVYYPVKDPENALRSSFIVESGTYKEVFGIPEMEYPNLVKVGPHYGPEVDPDARDAADVSSVISCVSGFVRDHFRFLEPSPSIVEFCLYTTTPDALCVLDTHPEYPNIAIACGFSGSGFKISPMVGSIMADFATGKVPPEYVKGFLSCSRFEKADYSRVHSSHTFPEILTSGAMSE